MRGSTPFSRFWDEFSENKIAVVALATVVLFVGLAITAPLFAPQDPYDLANLNLMDARRPPGYVGSAGYTHILGTDAQGRDLFSAILYGLKISLQIGVTMRSPTLANPRRFMSAPLRPENMNSRTHS